MPAVAEKVISRSGELSLAATAKAYLELIKPERTLVNVLTAAAGFLLASAWSFPFHLLFYTIIGTTLVIASGCVSNNLLDQRIDKVMKRTHGRVLATGTVSNTSATALALILGLTGLFLLSLVNWLTFWLAVIAFISYVFIYGWAKRKTVWSTLIGTLPGGLSLVAGYTAVTNQLDLTALLLFLVMLCWQMAHFYAIAVFRQADYASAKLPIWSVKKGVDSAHQQVIGFEILFLVTGLFLAAKLGSWMLAVVIGVISLWWLKASLAKSDKWARASFGVSLSVMLIFCVAVAVSSLF